MATGSSELVPRPQPQKRLPFPSPEQAAVSFPGPPALLGPNLGPGLRALTSRLRVTWTPAALGSTGLSRRPLRDPTPRSAAGSGEALGLGPGWDSPRAGQGRGRTGRQRPGPRWASAGAGGQTVGCGWGGCPQAGSVPQASPLTRTRGPLRQECESGLPELSWKPRSGHCGKPHCLGSRPGLGRGSPPHAVSPQPCPVPPGQDPRLFLQTLQTLWSTRELRQVSRLGKGSGGHVGLWLGDTACWTHGAGGEGGATTSRGQRGRLLGFAVCLLCRKAWRTAVCVVWPASSQGLPRPLGPTQQVPWGPCRTTAQPQPPAGTSTGPRLLLRAPSSLEALRSEAALVPGGRGLQEPCVAVGGTHPLGPAWPPYPHPPPTP